MIICEIFVRKNISKAFLNNYSQLFELLFLNYNRTMLRYNIKKN